MILNIIVFLAVATFTSANEILTAEAIPEGLSSDVNQRIWNGNNATSGQFPYQALLIMTMTDGNLSFCGGSLISTKTILTAAHCCAGVSTIKAHLGLTSVSERNNDYIQKFDVPSSSFVIHENYDPQTISNDICLLKLPSEATLNANVSTVALPEKSDQNPAQYDFKSATISGFGQTNDAEGLHPFLQWSSVRMQPHKLCELWYVFINKVATSQLCSGKLPWTGPCHGDSGGPITIKDAAGKQVEIGLVSWGVGSCGSFNPVVYTYVPYFLDWIKKNMV